MSYITNFEDTGLIKVDSFLSKKVEQMGKFVLSESDKVFLKELLIPYNISFVLEGINRMQSTLLCELGLSYVQQSQRYVEMDSDYSLPLWDTEDEPYIKQIQEVLDKAFALYTRMSEKKCEVKGRPKNEDYKYGIPIEDARYILPLSTKTNMIVSCNASKLIDIFELFNSTEYYYFFTDLFHELKTLLPNNLSKVLSICMENKSIFNYETYYEHLYEYVNPQHPVALLNSFSDSYERVGLGAWTSSQALTASELKEKYKDNLEEKSLGVLNRVIGYGHTAIIEHSRSSFVLEMSLVTYHQFIRHRLTEKHREPFSNLIDKPHNYIIPETIQKSEFATEYKELIKEIVILRKNIPDKFKYFLLLNCETIRLVSSSNARIDCENMKERICFTAQWEIRNIYTQAFELLYKKYPDIYKFALPPCVNGVCKEGKMTCGKALEMKNKYEQ